MLHLSTLFISLLRNNDSFFVFLPALLLSVEIGCIYTVYKTLKWDLLFLLFIIAVEVAGWYEQRWTTDYPARIDHSSSHFVQPVPKLLLSFYLVIASQLRSNEMYKWSNPNVAWLISPAPPFHHSPITSADQMEHQTRASDSGKRINPLQSPFCDAVQFVRWVWDLWVRGQTRDNFPLPPLPTLSWWQNPQMLGSFYRNKAVKKPWALNVQCAPRYLCAFSGSFTPQPPQEHKIKLCIQE